MDTCWLDFRCAFTVVCGIAFGNYTEFSNLYEYAKNHNIVTATPKSIRMYAGTKQLLIHDNKYSIQFTIHDSIWSQATEKDKEFICKMSVGKFNKLCHKSSKIYISKDNQYEKYHLVCSNVFFTDRTLFISDIDPKYIGSKKFMDEIRWLDLQILMSLTDQINFSDIHSAVYNMCLNLGQAHWMGLQTDMNEESDVYWYDKPFK